MNKNLKIVEQVSKYFNSQVYDINTAEDLTSISNMTIDEIKSHVFHFEDLGYIIYTLCIAGAPIQHIQNDLNKFIHYYIISNLSRDIIPEYIIKTSVRKALSTIIRYKEFEPDVFSITIDFIEYETKKLIEILLTEEYEEYESCENLRKSIDELRVLLSKN